MSWEDDNILYDDLDDFWEDDEANPTLWITKEGGVIDIQDMDPSHLRNTIAFITRQIGDDISHPWNLKRLIMLTFLKNTEAKGE